MLDLPQELTEWRDSLRHALDVVEYQRFLDAVEPYSFHLNMVGVGLCRMRMAELGMLAGGKPAPFPEYPSWNRSLYSSEAEHRAANPKVWEAYADAELSASSQRGQGSGIPRFKLESNGPWIVVEEEVCAALAVLDRSDPAASVRGPDAWIAWVDWLRRSSAGFEVS